MAADSSAKKSRKHRSRKKTHEQSLEGVLDQLARLSETVKSQQARLDTLEKEQAILRLELQNARQHSQRLESLLLGREVPVTEIQPPVAEKSHQEDVQRSLQRLHEDNLKNKIYQKLWARERNYVISKWKLSTKDRLAIAEALKVNTTLIKLKISETHLGDGSCKAIGDALKINTALKTLYLNNVGLESKGCKVIADALKINTTLTSLDLFGNMIEGDGCAALADALKINCALRILYLGRNPIDDEGCRAMAAALRTNTTLTKLDLSETEISDAAKQDFRSTFGQRCYFDEGDSVEEESTSGFSSCNGDTTDDDDD